MALTSCSTTQLVKSLAIDPCVVLPGTINLNTPLMPRPISTTCRAVPLNQDGKADYDREIHVGDIVLTPEHYAALQKKIAELKGAR